ncbi:MAG: BlaI/MecI/CopY family transcriptional regulator [Candidatus Zixiibacteriota bacterium]
MADDSDIKIKVDPQNGGIEKFFGRLEAIVMDIVWANGPLTVKRALYFINKNNKYAYTTIMTIMSRLTDKGFLKREKVSHSYLYSASMEKKKFIGYAVEKTINSLMADFQSATTKAYYDSKKSSSGKKSKSTDKKN